MISHQTPTIQKETIQMNEDAIKSIIEDAHKLAKSDIAPDLVKP